MSTTTPLIITDNLDRIEHALPALPARIFHLQRAVTGATVGRSLAAWKALAGSSFKFLDTARTSGKTVTGQARAAGEDVAKTTRTGVNSVVGQARAATGNVAASARTGARTVTGQAGAQGRKVSRTASKEATGLVDSAIDAVEDTVDATERVVDRAATAATTTSPGSGRSYEQRTKAELLERAQELDIEGRSQMSKGQLIKALRNA